MLRQQHRARIPINPLTVAVFGALLNCDGSKNVVYSHKPMYASYCRYYSNITDPRYQNGEYDLSEVLLANGMERTLHQLHRLEQVRMRQEWIGVIVPQLQAMRVPDIWHMDPLVWGKTLWELYDCDRTMYFYMFKVVNPDAPYPFNQRLKELRAVVKAHARRDDPRMYDSTLDQMYDYDERIMNAHTDFNERYLRLVNA